MNNRTNSRSGSSGRFGEDMQFRVVDSIPEYEKNPSGSIIKVPVVRINEQSGLTERNILGFLWYSKEENAAGYVPIVAMAPDSYNSSLVWIERLRSAKRRSLGAAAAIKELAGMEPTSVSGHVLIDDAQVVESLAKLKESASK